MIFQIDFLGCVHGSSSFLNKKSFVTYLAGPFASFIMELPGSHHHWLVNHLPSFLLRELFILLLWWCGPGRRDLTLRQRWFGRSKLICQLRKNYQVVSKALGTTPHQNSFLSFKKHPQKSHPHSLHFRPSTLIIRTTCFKLNRSIFSSFFLHNKLAPTVLDTSQGGMHSTTGPSILKGDLSSGPDSVDGQLHKHTTSPLGLAFLVYQ